MTESTASAAPAAPAKVSFWEDLIDIFFQPVAVFQRRAKASAGPIFLFIVIAAAIITYTTFPSILPAIEGDAHRAIPQVLKQYPQLTAEQLQSSIDSRLEYGRYFGAAFFGAIVLVDGLFVWLLGKMFGATEGFGAAILISCYAFLPRVLASVIGGAQGLIMDPTALTSASQLSLGPARFLDPETANPFTSALLSRLDVTIVWQTVLLAVGLAVIGKVSRGKAVGFAIAIWIAGGLYVLRNAYLIS